MSLLDQSYNFFAPIAKSDTAAIVTGLTDAVYVGTKGSTGTIVAVMQNGNTCTFVGLAAGTIYPLRLLRVNNTTTDASDLVALYIQ